MPLLTQSNLDLPRIEEGDAGILLKKGGGFVVFNCHKELDVENMTDRQTEQGRALQAFAVALAVPQIMDILIELANDKSIFPGPVVEIPNKM